MNRNVAAVLVAVLLVGVAATGGVVMGAAPTVDSETTETARSTNITDAGSQSYNATTTSNISWYADSNSSKILIEQDGRELYAASPDEYYHNSTSGNSYFNVTVADDGSDYTGLEVGANKNVTLNATLINDTSLDSPDKTGVNWTFANGEERAYVAQTESEANDSDVTAFAEYGVGAGIVALDGLSADGLTQPARVEQETTATENTSEVIIDFGNSSTADAFEAAQSDASTGDFLSMASVQMGDRRIPVFAESADADWLDTDEDVYATVSADGSEMTIHNAGELVDGSETVDITATGNRNIGFGETRTMLSNYDVSFVESVQLSSSAFRPPSFAGGTSFEG